MTLEASQGDLAIVASTGATIKLELVVSDGKAGVVIAAYDRTPCNGDPPSFVVKNGDHILNVTLNFNPAELPLDAGLDAVIEAEGAEPELRLTIWDGRIGDPNRPEKFLDQTVRGI